MRRFLFLSLAVLSVSAYSDPIHLKAVEFDPMVSRANVPFGLASPSVSPKSLAYYLIQVPDAAAPGLEARLASDGITVVAYIPENAFVVRSTLSKLKTSGLVTWSERFHPYFRMSPELGQTSLASADRLADRFQGKGRFVIHVFPGEDSRSIVAGAVAKGFNVVDRGFVGPHELIEVHGRLSQVRDLARMEPVQFIEEAPDVTLRNDKTTWVVQSNQANVRTLWDNNIKGQNMTVGLIDGPMYMNHNCFVDPVNNTPGPNHRKVVMYSSSSGTGSDSHGTHTAGTIAGDREPINGQTLNNGHAPKARIAFTNLSDVSGSNLYSKFVGAYNAGAKDHSNSWGNDGTRSYTSHCQAIDQFSYDFEDAMVAFAVSNGSVVTTPENAKSVLAVGATNQTPNQETIGSGGTGPTLDGRRKPEIFAPGVGIVSASSGTTDSFRSFTGTSMACPAITSEAALVRQWFREGRYIESTIHLTTGVEPSGALVRAAMMNSSVNMTGPAGYPSNAEGWGRFLADNVLWWQGEGRRTKFRDVRRSSGLQTGQSRTFAFIVSDANAPLRITMSFTDFPAAINASSAWVNDLNLEVRAPNGTLYLGNDINTVTGESNVGGPTDPKNSTEMVLVGAPSIGLWTVTVRAAGVNQGNTQGYGVVVNGDLSPINPGG